MREVGVSEEKRASFAGRMNLQIGGSVPETGKELFRDNGGPYVANHDQETNLAGIADDTVCL